MERSSEAGTPLTEHQRYNDLLAGLGIFFLVLLIFFLAQLVVFGIELVKVFPDNDSIVEALSDPSMETSLTEMSTNGDVIAQVSFWAGLICTPIILLLTFLWKKQGWRSLLGVRPFQARPFFVWLGIFIGLILLIELLGSMSDAFQSDFMEKVMASTTSLPWLYLGVGLAAPFFEEFLIRGLLYGTLTKVMNIHAAIAITAGVFTLMHLQYNVLIMLLILPMGVVLGYARAKTGSIWVPIILHAINNSASIYFLS